MTTQKRIREWARERRATSNERVDEVSSELAAHLKDLDNPHQTSAGGGSVPEYILIQDTCLDGVDKHIAGPAQWDTSKMIVKEIRVTTTSTDWDMWLLQNDNGYATDDATVGKYQLMGAGNGDESIFVDRPYEDEDGTNEIHLYYVDNAGSASATVSVVATELA